MTHVVPDRVSEIPVQPVAVVSQPGVAVVATNNVKFEIKGTSVNFYETTEGFNNRDVFETFDLARAGAIQAFAQHKQDVLVALERTEKDLLVVSESNIQPVGAVVSNESVAVAPAVAPVAAPAVAAPVASATPAVRANSPAVQVTPIA